MCDNILTNSLQLSFLMRKKKGVFCFCESHNVCHCTFKWIQQKGTKGQGLVYLFSTAFRKIATQKANSSPSLCHLSSSSKTKVMKSAQTLLDTSKSIKKSSPQKRLSDYTLLDVGGSTWNKATGKQVNKHRCFPNYQLKNASHSLSWLPWKAQKCRIWGLINLT